MRSIPLLAAALLASAAPAQSQDTSSRDKDRTPEPDRRVWIERDIAPRAVRIFGAGDMMSARSMIGVSTSSSGIRDTLGLLVTSITPNGPAEKAGIVEGNRIAAINGVNLRLSAADAGEPDMQGITARRLTRELGKIDPGKEVELRLWADGQFKTVRVKTVARDSLLPARYARSGDLDDRAVLGFSLSAGSKRDTIGVLIGSLTEDGPAEKAGLIEGDRVVSVNGTDLRVAREDAGDDWAGSTMVNRFQRVMRSVKPGDKVQLRVWSGGQTKNVTITAAKASELYKSDRRFRIGPMSMGAGDWAPFIAPVPAMPPMPPMPAITPRVRINSFDMDDDDLDDVSARIDVERALEQARAADAAAGARARVSTRALMSSAANLAAAAPVAAAVWSADMANMEREAAEARGTGRIVIPGLSLAPVTKELAEYLGKGSENGYLVLESSGSWGALHAGDVIIAIDGSSMQDGAMLSTEGAHEYLVLRKGRKTTVRM
ncbi:MAG: PDZ domain-containing protein [Gemmatimonadaceae bacterium]|nr:PDZ domain-containing protein [Gemmatimonadaceae bacterium]NUQ92304.1 PDZ domain-containing protein [Gemmatimonadaceae bacterium]NUR19721.1 PDZ domain-containing protein [Gemmatimonadaceae bacterium]NUS98724.1 PDZ domain-containing protein [Gemmatimonadaceae bacterium]